MGPPETPPTLWHYGIEEFSRETLCLSNLLEDCAHLMVRGFSSDDYTLLQLALQLPFTLRNKYHL